jgi:hypothetical protein
MVSYNPETKKEIMKKIHILLLLFGVTLSRTNAQTEGEIGVVLDAGYSTIITGGDIFSAGHAVLGFGSKESNLWFGIGANIGSERPPYEPCACYVPPPVWRNQHFFGLIGYQNEELRIGAGPGISLSNSGENWSGNLYFDYRDMVWLSGIGSIDLDLNKVLKIDLAYPLNHDPKKHYVALGVEGMYLSDRNYEVVGTLSGYLRLGVIPEFGDFSVSAGLSFIKATPREPALFLKVHFQLDHRLKE